MKRLPNKVAIVTGAASGLGEAIAKGFSREGAKIIITDVNDIVNNGGTVFSLEQDVTSEAGSKKVIQKSLHKFGYIDIVVIMPELEYTVTSNPHLSRIGRKC